MVEVPRLTCVFEKVSKHAQHLLVRKEGVVGEVLLRNLRPPGYLPISYCNFGGTIVCMQRSKGGRIMYTNNILYYVVCTQQSVVTECQLQTESDFEKKNWSVFCQLLVKPVKTFFSTIHFCMYDPSLILLFFHFYPSLKDLL